MKDRLFQTQANTFHPMFSLMWATVLLLYFTPLCMLPALAKWTLFGEVALFSFVMPLLLIFWLYKRGKVADMALHDRNDRILPLMAQICYMLVLKSVLQYQGLPSWALDFYQGAVILSVVAWLVSMKWKISGHAMGNAAITTAAFVLYCRFPYIMPFIIPIGMLLITGLVGSIRLYFERHTLAQVAAGALAGCLSILVCMF